MEDAEIIRHKDRFDIFKQLQNDKTLIKMYVLGKQYERLTFVISTHLKKHDPYFIIDCPEGFMETTADVDRCSMLFEFAGNDNLFYNFRMHVEEARVRRLTKHPVTNQDNFALQFTDIKKSQEKILMELIFILQRNTLRQRL